MTNVIQEIQSHLKQYRQITKVPLDHLSTTDVSLLKGYARPPSSQELDYKRSWAKLAKAQRLNRLMNYHKKLTCDYDLDMDCQHQLKTLFYDGISSDILDRDNVSYDVSHGGIVKIEGLKRDTEGIFYFDRAHHGAVTKVPIQKFMPVSLTRLSEAQRKRKPVITLRNM
jgi:hypothetical protein